MMFTIKVILEIMREKFTGFGILLWYIFLFTIGICVLTVLSYFLLQGIGWIGLLVFGDMQIVEFLVERYKGDYGKVRYTLGGIILFSGVIVFVIIYGSRKVVKNLRRSWLIAKEVVMRRGERC